MSKEVNPIQANTHRQYLRREKADPEFSSNAKQFQDQKPDLYTQRGHASVNQPFITRPIVTPHTPAIGIIRSVVAFILIISCQGI
jgi:hypothetical protein